MSTTPITVRAAATGHRSHVPPWLGLLCAGLFVLHAANYLYFFVDDEAIPYVFAQNLLNGNGLRYNSFEGRVEGYSDFLHVLAAATILATVRLLHLRSSPCSQINTVWSLVCGVAIVWVTFGMLRRLPGIRAPGLARGDVFRRACRAPSPSGAARRWKLPPFALLVTLLVVVDDASAGARAARLDSRRLRDSRPPDSGRWVRPRRHRDRMRAAGRRRSRRRELLLRVVVPSVAVFATYHLWRVWYFGHVVPSPIATKVRLQAAAPTPALLVKGPRENYARAFLGLYGVAPLVALCGAGFVWSRRRSVAACGAAAAALTAYVAVVGDWMFGFRFFLPMLPLFAVLGGAFGVDGDRTAGGQLAGWLLAVGCVLWFAVVAAGSSRRYARLHHTESWLAAPDARSAPALRTLLLARSSRAARCCGLESEPHTTRRDSSRSCSISTTSTTSACARGSSRTADDGRVHD